MNKNYGSVEACQRLFKAGIAPETDFYWARGNNGWYLRSYEYYEREVLESIPAPSMAEVWRELPEGIEVNGSWAPLFVNKIGCGASVGYRIEHHIIIHFSNENPTDALIDLLIWVRKGKP